MIPALDKRGPERIITIKAGNYQLIGKIVARCAEHLDEFLRRSIPLRKSSFSYFYFEISKFIEKLLTDCFYRPSGYEIYPRIP